MNYIINVVTFFSEVAINMRQTDLSSFSEDLHTTIFTQYNHQQCTDSLNHNRYHLLRASGI